MFFPISDNIPHRRVPYVNYGIILACVLVFVYQVAHPQAAALVAFRPSFVLSEEVLQGGGLLALWTALVSMFLHGGVGHLVFNMWFLWIFGDNVEDRMGHLRYLLFYLLCGYVATLVHAVVTGLGVPLSGARALDIPVVGASGAIAGVLGAYYKLYPRASIRTVLIFFLIMFVEVPAGVFIMLWFLLQLLMGLGAFGMAGGGVGFWAHVGGFLAGLALVGVFAYLPRRRPPAPRVLDVEF